MSTTPWKPPRANPAVFPTFDECAATMAKNGYAVLPIRRGEKKPAVLENWTAYEYDATDPEQYRGAGVGILTKRTPVIDVDVRDERCAAEIAALIESDLGPAPKRIGSAPKAAYLCQIEGEPFGKVQTRSYVFREDVPGDKPHQVEVLADGQQVVCFNVHPDTKKPYTWNGRGDPLTVPADLLPTLSAERARALIAKAELILSKYGKPISTLKKSDTERVHAPSDEQLAANPRQLREALSHIRNADLDYDDWIHIGHAIKGALGEEGRDDFLNWSAQSAKDNPTDTLAKWESFKPTRIGAGSIYYLAQSAGWQRIQDHGAGPHEFAPAEAYADETAAADKGQSTDEAKSTWTPPQVVTYGASFNPAAIPLREWVITGRYALGEGSAIAGPPGVNKSSLLLIDAVQIATGRNLIGDRIERTGAVLVLVGEDRRRDFEARLAAVCLHFHVAPADLKDRLHVVYQTELDPTDYALGSMVREMAVLNTHMLAWLRQYPDLTAIFIDPMSSWHYMIENDNNAMGVLCLAIRNLAAQTNRAVAFDHHVTKLAMADPEAHVHNMAAMRGGSIIVAQMRWASTMAKLKPETAVQFGIAEEERWLYRRLDPLKASYGPDGDAPRLLKVEVVTIANGEPVGILTPVNVDAQRAAGKERQETAAKEHREFLADALGRMLRDKAPRSTAEAALWITQNEPTLFVGKNREQQSDRTIRRKLPTAIGTGLEWQRLGGSIRIIVKVSGKGNATRQDIDFEQGDMSGQPSGQ